MEEKRKAMMELVPSIILGDPRLHTPPYIPPETREDVSMLANADLITSNLDTPQMMLSSLLFAEALQIALRIGNTQLVSTALSGWLASLAHTKAKEGKVLHSLLSLLRREEEEEGEEEEKWFWKRKKEEKGERK